MPPTLAQVLYEAYCEQAGWRSLATGDPLPPWNDLKPSIQVGWQASAVAAGKYFKQVVDEHLR